MNPMLQTFPSLHDASFHTVPPPIVAASRATPCSSRAPHRAISNSSLRAAPVRHATELLPIPMPVIPSLQSDASLSSASGRLESYRARFFPQLLPWPRPDHTCASHCFMPDRVQPCRRSKPTRRRPDPLSMLHARPSPTMPMPLAAASYPVPTRSCEPPRVRHKSNSEQT